MSRVYKYINATGAYDPRPRKPYGVRIDPTGAISMIRDENEINDNGATTSRTPSNKPNETSMNKQHPYWPDGVLRTPYATLVPEIEETFNTLAEVINRHMEAQGFWDDEDAVLAALSGGVAWQAEHLGPSEEGETAELNHLEQVAKRWKNAEKYMLINTELTECVEGDRAGSYAKSDKIPEFTQLEEEMADVVIRVLDFAGRRKLRIGAALIAKMEYNASREFRHGKKF